MFDKLTEKAIKVTEQNERLKKEIKLKSDAFNQLLEYVLEFTNIEDSEVLQDIVSQFEKSTN